MKKVYKQAAYAFGWNGPIAVFDGKYKKPAHSHKRLVEDKETGMLSEYEHAYIHGATERIDEERIE